MYPQAMQQTIHIHIHHYHRSYTQIMTSHACFSSNNYHFPRHYNVTNSKYLASIWHCLGRREPRGGEGGLSTVHAIC